MSLDVKIVVLFAFVAAITSINLITEMQIKDIKTEIMVQGKLLQMDDQRLSSLEKPSNTTVQNSSTDPLDKLNCNQVNALLKDVGYGLNSDSIHDDIVMKATKLQPYCQVGIVLPNPHASELYDIIVKCSSIYETSDDKWHYRTGNGTDFTADQLLSRGNCN